jgi:hypothetical protein
VCCVVFVCSCVLCLFVLRVCCVVLCCVVCVCVCVCVKAVYNEELINYDFTVSTFKK